MKTIKILYILDYFLPHVWWVEIVFDNIIKNLPHNYRVIILTSHHDKNLPKYEKKDLYEIYRIGSRLSFILRGIPLAIRLARHVDIIHCSNYAASWLGGILKLFTTKPRILTVHEIFWKLRYKFMWWKGLFFHVFEKCIFILYSFDFYTTVSYYTKNALRISHGIKDSKMKTIYNGIEYEHWKRTQEKEKTAKKLRKKFDIQDTDFLLLSYGRAGVSKWMTDLIPTFEEYKQKYMNSKMLLILSQAEQYNTILEQHKKSKYKKDIIIVSSIAYAELPNYILMANVVLLPTRAEWFWFAITETNSLNIPLVTCSIWSVPEVVSWNTILAEPGNIDQYVQAIEDLQNGEIEQLPKKKFYWKEAVKNYVQLYEKIITGQWK